MPKKTIPVLYGAPYSVYVRAVRLTLEEKSVPYELVPIDIFAPEGAPLEHKARHPFGKIPAFEHAGFRLYEAGAITRYVDEAFPGPLPGPVWARRTVIYATRVAAGQTRDAISFDLFSREGVC
jgi:glutathione S-transferase